MKKYQIAIYIRLSKEDNRLNDDNKLKEESNSITMQRILLQKYTAENFADYELLEFCDDGYSGTNFERPGMQAMLERVRNSEINCIVVKDFSRFARDYIELGSYLEQIFPFLGVRFISINDVYDSREYQGSLGGIDTNFKNLLYDLYSKDLSKKVRSSLAVRKETGHYVSGHSPFGYKKSPADRHALLIAEDEAEIVRQIFSLTLDGFTSVEIARLFNETQVKTPLAFKVEKEKINRTPKGERFLWNSSTICQILRNEIYIGNIVQKKYTKDFVGGKNHLTPRESWLVAPNHHEPIIDKAVFDQVQQSRGKKKTPQCHPTHPLIGTLVCGCCKKNLQYRRGLKPYFTCPYRYSNAMENCIARINAMFLEQYVFLMLQDKLEASGELKRLHQEAEDKIEHEIRELKEKKRLLTIKIEKRKQQSFDAYQNYVYGKTAYFQSDKEVVEALKKELAHLNNRLQDAEAACRRMKCERNTQYSESQPPVLSKEMIAHAIEKIEIYHEQHIEIQWKKAQGQN